VNCIKFFLGKTNGCLLPVGCDASPVAIRTDEVTLSMNQLVYTTGTVH